jgi:hypothetical protein
VPTNLRRAGARVRAKGLIDGEWMCKDCFSGKPLATKDHGPSIASTAVYAAPTDESRSIRA